MTFKHESDWQTEQDDDAQARLTEVVRKLGIDKFFDKLRAVLLDELDDLFGNLAFFLLPEETGERLRRKTRDTGLLALLDGDRQLLKALTLISVYRTYDAPPDVFQPHLEAEGIDLDKTFAEIGNLIGPTGFALFSDLKRPRMLV